MWNNCLFLEGGSIQVPQAGPWWVGLSPMSSSEVAQILLIITISWVLAVQGWSGCLWSVPRSVTHLWIQRRQHPGLLWGQGWAGAEQDPPDNTAKIFGPSLVLLLPQGGNSSQAGKHDYQAAITSQTPLFFRKEKKQYMLLLNILEKETKLFCERDFIWIVCAWASSWSFSAFLSVSANEFISLGRMCLVNFSRSDH